MKTIVAAIMLLCCFSYCIAQDNSAPSDTNLTILRTPDPGLLLEKPVFVLPLTFALLPAVENQRLPLYQSFAGVPQSFTWDRPAQIDLTAPLMLQLYAAEKERPWRITLGAATTAGALYIAYKHLKKYGFQ